MKVKLLSYTQPSPMRYELRDTQRIISYCARVSNPNNQHNSESSEKLLKYLIKNKHWSPFEMASMCVEIHTTRAISPQILRHRSFSFQEFSQRYAIPTDTFATVLPELRRQDTENRQNSIDDLPSETAEYYEDRIDKHFREGVELYESLLHSGVAKECARFVLPLATPTRIYMTGSCRSWIHYISLRTANGTQKEHMDLANDCKKIFIEQYPTVAEALEWK